MTKSLEDYLEVIHNLVKKNGGARVVDIAKELDVKMPSVNNAVKELDKKGYVVYEKYQLIRLTPDGEREANAIFSRHVLLKDFLLSIGVSEQIAEHDACLMEHNISQETLDKLKLVMKKGRGIR